MLPARPSNDFLLGGATSLLASLVVFTLAALWLGRVVEPHQSWAATAAGVVFDATNSASTSTWRQTLYDTLEELEVQFGQNFFQRSVSHAGTCARLKSVLARAQRGELISVALIGGSITAGRGLPFEGRNQAWGQTFGRIWNETFPHPDFALSVGAIPGKGSLFWHTHEADWLPSLPDLVVFDTAANDDRVDADMETYDLMLRAVLGMDSRPAVVQLEFMRLSTYDGRLGSGGGGNQLDVARYLDVPSISLRNPLLPAMLVHPERVPLFQGRGWLTVDPLHPGLRAHYAAAKALQHFIVTQLLDIDDHAAVTRARRVNDRRAARLASTPAVSGDASSPGHGAFSANLHAKLSNEQNQAWEADLISHLDEVRFALEPDEPDLPRLALTDAFESLRPALPPRPVHASLTGTRHILTPLNITLGKKVVAGAESGQLGDGWTTRELPFSTLYSASHLFSDSPGARVSFELPQLGMGEVRLDILRSKTRDLGVCRCWMDNDDTNAVLLNGAWDLAGDMDASSTIRTGLEPGQSHALHCELLTGSFYLAAVITL